MAKKPEQKPDDEEQSRRFVEAAISSGATNAHNEFERVINNLARPSAQTTQSPQEPPCRKKRSRKASTPR